eukprot:7771337-Pyramimonas_sp.AAC.1
MDALHDVEKLRKALEKLPSWRATPAWSVAGDLSRVLAMPNWYYKRRQRRGLRGPDEPQAREPVGHEEEDRAR